MELKDTTLRSIIFKQSIIELEEKNGKYENKKKVTNENFKVYEEALISLAKVSRITYLDSGVIRLLLIDNIFSKSLDNFNETCRQLREENRHLSYEKSQEPNSMVGFPPKSFIIDSIDTKTKKKPLAVYVSTPKGLVFLCISGTKIGSIFKSTDLIIAFKGTSTYTDISVDLKSAFTTKDLDEYLFGKSTGKKVASSFLELLNDGIKILDKLVLDYNPKRLFLTGHSLGGALSSIYSLICALKKVPCSIHNVTFGSPTVFSSGLRNVFNEFLDSEKITLDRVVARMLNGFVDVITAIPLGYSHPGFQPGTLEINPEKKGRVYNLSSIKKNYIGGSESKTRYHKETLTHMPNRLVFQLETNSKLGHGLYLGVLFGPAFRRNEGSIASSLKTGIFYCNIYEDGIRFNYDGEIQLPKKT